MSDGKQKAWPVSIDVADGVQQAALIVREHLRFVEIIKKMSQRQTQPNQSV